MYFNFQDLFNLSFKALFTYNDYNNIKKDECVTWIINDYYNFVYDFLKIFLEKKDYEFKEQLGMIMNVTINDYVNEKNKILRQAKWYKYNKKLFDDYDKEKFLRFRKIRDYEKNGFAISFNKKRLEIIDYELPLFIDRLKTIHFYRKRDSEKIEKMQKQIIKKYDHYYIINFNDKWLKEHNIFNLNQIEKIKKPIENSKQILIDIF